MPGSSSQGIFLSYRREDAGPYARSLQRELSDRIPDARIFMDLDSIEPGLDFVEVIQGALDSCAVLVALIGRQWVTLTDEEGARRLDNPDDYVRFEVKTALEHGVRVIPVLLDGAMPLRQQELPAELHKLARLNAAKLSYDRYLDDVNRLLDTIHQVVTAAEADRKAREEADSKAREEADRTAREEADRQAREEADRQAREEADRQARATSRNGSPPKRPTQAAPPSLTGPSTLAQYLTDHKKWGGLQFLGATVAFSPDGRLLACGGGEMTVRVWDPVAGTQPRTLTGHTKNVLAVAFSPDGRLLASAGWDKTVRLWDPVAGTDLRTLTGHTKNVTAVAFSPDGRLLASAGHDKTIRLWDPAAGTSLRILTGHTGMVLSVAFSPDGRLLASFGADPTIRLWT